MFPADYIFIFFIGVGVGFLFAANMILKNLDEST